MKPAARKGDMCTGHGSAKPRPSTEGSPNVFINGKPAHRKGDKWRKHKDHDSVLDEGSPVVFTNGKPQGRRGDRVRAPCKSRVAQGSPNVFVGSSSSGGNASGGGGGAGSAGVDYSNPYRFSEGGAGASGYSGAGTLDEETGIDENDSDSEFSQDPIDASDEEIDWLTTCMMDEALNQRTRDAWAAVAQVVINRLPNSVPGNPLNPAWAGTIKGVVLARNAFSGFYFDMRGGRYVRVVRKDDWAGAERRGKQKMAKYRRNSRWDEFKAVGQQVLAQTFPGGPAFRLIRSRRSRNYLNPRISRQSWANPSTFIARIEDHSFYKG